MKSEVSLRAPLHDQMHVTVHGLLVALMSVCFGIRLSTRVPACCY